MEAGSFQEAVRKVKVRKSAAYEVSRGYDDALTRLWTASGE